MDFDDNAFADVPRVFQLAANDDKPRRPKAHRRYVLSPVQGIHAETSLSRHVDIRPVRSRHVPVPPKPKAPKEIIQLTMPGTMFLPPPPVVLSAEPKQDLNYAAPEAAVAAAVNAAAVAIAQAEPLVTIPAEFARPAAASSAAFAPPPPVVAVAEPAPVAIPVEAAPKRKQLKLPEGKAKAVPGFKDASTRHFVTASAVKKDPMTAFQVAKEALLKTEAVSDAPRTDSTPTISWKKLEADAMAKAAAARQSKVNIDFAARFQAEMRALQAELAQPELSGNSNPAPAKQRTLVA